MKQISVKLPDEDYKMLTDIQTYLEDQIPLEFTITDTIRYCIRAIIDNMISNSDSCNESADREL